MPTIAVNEEHAPVNWVTAILFTLLPLAALIFVPWYGITHGFSTASVVLFFVFLWAGGVSITAGYHRLWSHRAYSAHWSVRLFLMLFGAMSLQNSILIWASQHRTHHRFVDDVERDPYSAKRGFWFSHMGWILRNYKSGENDFSNARDLERDPMVMFQHRYYLPLMLATNVALPLALGWLVGDMWGVFLLAGLLRLVVNHHFTWFINSLAHMWGAQPYTDENTARDNGWLALITYGEGYHNFHHIFQNDYRNGVKWYQFDPTKWIIAGLARIAPGDRLEASAGSLDPARPVGDAVQACRSGTRGEAQQPRAGGRASRTAQGTCRRGIRGVQEVPGRVGRRSVTNGLRTASSACCSVGKRRAFACA